MGTAMADPKVAAEYVKGLSAIEAADLARALEEEWGVSAAHAVEVSAGVNFAAEAATEPTEFDVILIGGGSNKIAVIKEVRAITHLGLSEAKALVESVPNAIREGVSKAEAEKLKANIESLGGSVKISPFPSSDSINQNESALSKTGSHDSTNINVHNQHNIFKFVLLIIIGALIAYGFGPISPFKLPLQIGHFIIAILPPLLLAGFLAKILRS